MLKQLFLYTCCVIIVGCSAVKVVEPKKYILSGVSNKKLAKSVSAHSVFVAPVNAAAGYETNDMIYSTAPLQLNAFVKSEWIAPPAKMLRTAVASSLQNTGYFKGVLSRYSDSDVRFKVNVSLLTLKQNFIVKPNQVNLTLKVEVIDAKHHKVLSSQRFTEKRNGHMETPYAGVVAANKANKALMMRISSFVIKTCQNA